MTDYHAQRRGGRGKAATAMKEEDFVDKLFVANTHDTLLCFSSVGKLYWLQGLPAAAGEPRLARQADRQPAAAAGGRAHHGGAADPRVRREQVRVHGHRARHGQEDLARGVLAAARRPASSPSSWTPGDRLVGVDITDGHRQIILCSSGGKAIRFDENDVRPMGRTAAGVRGIRLPVSEEVISLIIVDEQGMVLTASQNGYGKRTLVEDFPLHGRGGQGVIALQISERNGQMVGALLVKPDDEIMLISSSGTLVRTPRRGNLDPGPQYARRKVDPTRRGRSARRPGADPCRGRGERRGACRVEAVSGWRLAVSADRRRLVETRQPRFAFRYSSNVIPFGDGAWYTASLSALTANRQPLTASSLTTPMRVFNFSPGPAVLPQEVLEQAREEMLDWHGTGMSVMEMSHRGKAFISIAETAEADLRELLAVPKNYKVLFLQGGATGQFAAIPLNLTTPESVVDYVNTGSWSKKAIGEAKHYARVNVAADAGEPYASIPSESGWKRTPDAAYLHYTPNETIGGVEFHFVPQASSVPLVADMSSTILSRPIDVAKFGVIYAGAQKNIGPAGLTLVIVREDLLGRARPATPAFMDFAAMAKEGSMLNTPPTFAWYMAGLVFQWLKRQGGLQGIGERNRAKAQKLYAAIDGSSFYRNPVAKDARSWMNVPFTLANPELDRTFAAEAKQAGLVTLEGHRSVGGMRASLYNAMSMEGVNALVDFMRTFEKKHG